MNKPSLIISLGSGQPKPKSWRGLPIERRFALQVSVLQNGCWLWTGACSKNGYGAVYKNRRLIGAHRLAYELFRGPIYIGCEIDHLCRNRKCVNPYHLEAVSHSVNVIRGTSPSAIRKRLGVCVRGHPMTPENRDFKKRRCRVCEREKAHERWARTHPNYGKNPNYIKNPAYHV